MSPTDDGDSETVQACPACDSSSVATNNIGGIQSVNPDADRYRCADCYETFDEPEERERRQDTFFRPDSLAAKLDAAEPDDLVTDGGVDRRRRIAIRGNPVWMDTPAGYEEWIDSLPSTFDLDDGFTETARGGAKFVMLDPKRDPLDRPLTDHRRGLCFDVESTEMREACHEAIAEHLDTEPASRGSTPEERVSHRPRVLRA